MVAHGRWACELALACVRVGEGRMQPAEEEVCVGAGGDRRR
jgi:hypothetical protein